MQTKHINQFTFNQASYAIVGNNNEQLTLEVDYANNHYHIQGTKSLQNFDLVQEAQTIATDLLKRKHNKNMAEIYKR